MWFYAIVLPYLTGWTLLIENISLVVFGVLSVMILILFVGGLMAIVLLTVLLPIYLFGLLQLAIREIALRLQTRFTAPARKRVFAEKRSAKSSRRFD